MNRIFSIVLNMKGRAAIMAMVVSLLSVFGAGDSFARKIEAELLLMKETVYNTLFVLQEGEYRTLRFGYRNRHFRESTYNPNDPTELYSPYTRYVTVGLAYPNNLRNAAVIGMGGGRTTWYLSHFVPNLKITAVELDPDIIKIADEYFDVRESENVRIIARDGRIFLRRTKDSYDFIVVDAYRGHYVPFHLLTKEFYELLESRLTEGGAVIQNIAPSTMLFDYALATIGTVFDNVDLYKAGGNIVAIAYNGSRRTNDVLVADGSARQAAFGLRYDITEMVKERIRTPDWDTANILTDDFAPANYLKSIEIRNRKWEQD